MCPDMGETPHPHQTHPAPTQSSLPVHIRFSLTSGGPTTSAGSLSGVFTGLGGSSTGGAGPGGGSLAAAASSAVIGAVPATTTPRDRGLPPPRFDEDVQLPLIKVAVLGAAGVGKTSLIKHFVSNDFSNEHTRSMTKIEFFPTLVLNDSLFELKVTDLPPVPLSFVKRFVSNDFSNEHTRSTTKTEFFPTLVLNDSLFELKVTDLPPVPFFPKTTEAEWRGEFRFYGLRSASAYILVYDMSSPATFQYIKRIRDQMFASREMSNVPIVVVANKSDLVSASVNSAQSRKGGFNLNSNNGNTTQRAGDRARKDVAQLVKKNWRASHVECSSKYNSNVVAVFKELAVLLDMIAHGQTLGGTQTHTKRKKYFVF